MIDWRTLRPFAAGKLAFPDFCLFPEGAELVLEEAGRLSTDTESDCAADSSPSIQVLIRPTQPPDPSSGLMDLQKVLRIWSAAMPPRQQVAGASTNIRRTYAHNATVGLLLKEKAEVYCSYMIAQRATSDSTGHQGSKEVLVADAVPLYTCPDDASQREGKREGGRVHLGEAQLTLSCTSAGCIAGRCNKNSMLLRQ